MPNIKRALAFFLAVLLLSLPLLSCSSTKQERAVIGTCAGHDVLYEELRYVTLTYKDLFEATYGEGIWDDPTTAEKYRKELEDTVWSMMLNNYAVLAACQKYGMTIDSMYDQDIEDAIDEQIEQTVAEYGSKSAYKDALKSMYMTEHFLRFCLRVAFLENELKYILTKDLGFIETDLGSFIDWLEDGNCVYVQHIFIRNDEGEDPEENRATAERIRLELEMGADIGEYVGSSVNQDLENLRPYFLVRDVYTEIMENAAFALTEVGAVSEVIDTGDGYYVMVRQDYGEADLLAKAPELLTSYQWAKAESVAEEMKKDLTIEKNEYGKSIDLLEIK